VDGGQEEGGKERDKKRGQIDEAIAAFHQAIEIRSGLRRSAQQSRQRMTDPGKPDKAVAPPAGPLNLKPNDSGPQPRREN